MKVTRIHKVLEFDQKAFLAPYIEFNTKKRPYNKIKFRKRFLQADDDQKLVRCMYLLSCYPFVALNSL